MSMSLCIGKNMCLCIGKKSPPRVAAAEAADEKLPPRLAAAEPEQPQQRATSHRTGSMLGNEYKDVKLDYKLGKEIGRGTFAVAYSCKDKSTRKKYACKQIAKRKIVTKSQKENLKREVIIMDHLIGQQNFVQLKGTYEDDKYVHLVMELCDGGELYDQMISKGRYSEKIAAQILCSIMKGVYCLHFMGVMHRDLKPENFLLAKKAASPCLADYTMLKAIDFGLSAYIDEETPNQEKVGTAFYVAPEILMRQPYDKEIDIWSVGVILYMLLTGVPPFYGESDHTIFMEVVKAKPDMESYPWNTIQDNAKKLVKDMLSLDPKKRPSAAEVLNHQWLKDNGVAIEDPMKELINDKMRYFRAKKKFNKVVRKILMEKTPPEDFDRLLAMFRNLDKKEEKAIPRQELEKSLHRFDSTLNPGDVEQIVEAADTDGDGHIDFDEFLIAMENFNQYKEEHLKQAFQHFAKDSNNLISKDELEEALKEYETVDIDVIISEIDKNKDGKISYDEFRAMITS